MTVNVIADALPSITKYLEQAPQITRRAARLALNQVADRGGIKLLRDEVNKQVAFPAGYVKDKIELAQRATDNRLEVVFTARARATSLARFSDGQVTPLGGKRTNLPVNVRVKPGASHSLKKAFLIRLLAGASLTEDHYNVGLAIRLKPGEKIAHKTKMVPFGGGLYLLYGPSVSQVFGDAADVVTPDILGLVETEFLRQFVRLSGD